MKEFIIKEEALARFKDTNEKFTGLFSSAKDDWETPQWLFEKYDAIYHFTLDAASSDDNAKVANHYTARDNGLSQKWGGTVWLNPPYGRQIGKWVKKAYEESKDGATVVCLLPSRTDTKWFHEYCIKGEITFIQGRLKFGNSKNSAPFPSMIVVFGAEAIPAADVRPVVRSHWRECQDHYYGWNIWECMNCHEEFVLEEGTPVDNEYKFCPNCGARMDGEE